MATLECVKGKFFSAESKLGKTPSFFGCCQKMRLQIRCTFFAHKFGSITFQLNDEDTELNGKISEENEENDDAEEKDTEPVKPEITNRPKTSAAKKKKKKKKKKAKEFVENGEVEKKEVGCLTGCCTPQNKWMRLSLQSQHKTITQCWGESIFRAHSSVLVQKCLWLSARSRVKLFQLL